ncbi:MAG: OadG family protein [Clostridiales bacterium]|nr:OadG family protein [Clostridiales bacterium]
MTLLERFADPTIIHSMSFGDKMLASTYVTILGMGITFMALIILWGAIVILGKVVRGLEKKSAAIQIVKESPKVQAVKSESAVEEDDYELVAVITAAIAAVTNQPINQIYVKNIRRVGDNLPVWQKAGIANQISKRM